MGYSININWEEEFKNNCDKWENIGRNVLIESCNHHNKETGKEETKARYYDYCEECDICEDSANPMMNYGYPLEIEPDDKDILKVIKETNCSVMYNTETNEHFLVLCGGGMDLSQDIALSYIILEKWIPKDLLMNVSKQPLLSLGRKNYKILAKEVISQLKSNADNLLRKSKEWKGSLRKLRFKEAEKISKKLNLLKGVKND